MIDLERIHELQRQDLSGVCRNESFHLTRTKVNRTMWW